MKTFMVVEDVGPTLVYDFTASCLKAGFTNVLAGTERVYANVKAPTPEGALMVYRNGLNKAFGYRVWLNPRVLREVTDEAEQAARENYERKQNFVQQLNVDRVAEGLTPVELAPREI